MMVGIKSIILPFYGSEEEVASVRCAFYVAHMFRAKVKLVHISSELEEISEYGIGATSGAYEQIIEKLEDELRKQEKHAHGIFKKCVNEYPDRAIQVSSSDYEFSPEWHHMAGKVDDVIAHEGRMVDLVLMSRSIVGQHINYHSAIIAALFETGRPVLLVPPELENEAVGKKIGIAWDRGVRATRAISASMPFLQHAEKTYIFTAKDENHRGPVAEELIQYLDIHGVEAEHINIDNKKKSIGEAITQEAVSRGVDMLVMGAFSHSRLRQMVLGGVTNYMLEETSIPVFMCH